MSGELVKPVALALHATTSGGVCLEMEKAMTFTDIEDDNDTQDDRTVTLRRDQIRAMERDAKTAREAQQRADKAERQLAIVRAGLDLSNPAVEFFAQHYAGEVTAEAVAAEAKRLGLLGEAPPPTPPVVEEPSAGDQNLSDLRDIVSQGSIPDSGHLPQKPVRESAMEEARTAIAKGMSGEDAMGSYFNRIAAAAQAGDSSVTIQGFRQD